MLAGSMSGGLPPRNSGSRPRQAGLIASAVGTVAGLAASWGAAWPAIASGAVHGVPTGQIVVSSLAGLWLASVGVALWRDLAKGNPSSH